MKDKKTPRLNGERGKSERIAPVDTVKGLAADLEQLLAMISPPGPLRSLAGDPLMARLVAAVRVIAPELFAGKPDDGVAAAVNVTPREFGRTVSAVSAILRTDEANAASCFDPTEYCVIAGGIVRKGFHADEGGPAAWLEHVAAPVDEAHLYGTAILQLAPGPTVYRPLIKSRVASVFIVSDCLPDSGKKRISAVSTAHLVGTYTEAAWLIEKVRWITPPWSLDPRELAGLVTNEVRLARAEDPAIDGPDEVLILLWRAKARSFSGASLLDLGNEIRDTVFTTGTETVPPFRNE